MKKIHHHHHHHCRNPLFCVLPPHMLEQLAQSQDIEIRKRAIKSLESAAAARAMRVTYAAMPGMAAVPSIAGGKERRVYDMQNARWPLPGTLIRSEAQADTPSGDPAADEAFDLAGVTYDFYQEIFERNSLNDQGMSLISSVHYGEEENNAYWTGDQMLYGDGDNILFTRFTKSLEVVAHELTHGVVQYTCNLAYVDESGALNEHFADALGMATEQWHRNLSIKQADWWLGGEIIAPKAGIRGIRTFTADKAYENNPYFGTDPQPKHMRDKYTGPADNGGVHINSGIPNHAFYLTAVDLGGNVWDKTIKIWYDAMLKLTYNSDFQAAAQATYESAGSLFGVGSLEQRAVKNAWEAVGISV